MLTTGLVHSDLDIAAKDIIIVWTSDWKFMNAVMGMHASYTALTCRTGLKAASADEACPWCSSTKESRQDTSRAWLTNATARINDRQLLQVDYCLLDPLHLLLRVGDQVCPQSFHVRAD